MRWVQFNKKSLDGSISINMKEEDDDDDWWMNELTTSKIKINGLQILSRNLSPIFFRNLSSLFFQNLCSSREQGKLSYLADMDIKQ